MCNPVFQRLRNLIADGAAEDALEQLMNLLSSQGNTGLGKTQRYRDFRNEVIFHLGSLRDLGRRLRLDPGGGSEIRKELIGIGHNALELIDDVERSMKGAGALLPAASVPAPAAPLPDSGYAKLEKIWGKNNLRRVAWLQEGLECAKAVCRVVSPAGYGTGFLLGNGFLMTNNHVLPSREAASAATVEFNYEEDLKGRLLPTVGYGLDADTFITAAELDCSLVRVAPNSTQPPLSGWGALILANDAKIEIGDHVTIIQHPQGGVKQIGVTANQVVNTFGVYLHYMTDTLPGSSGSPVFDAKWQVVALHHAGGEMRRDNSGATIYANEGVLISHIKRHDAFSKVLSAARADDRR